MKKILCKSLKKPEHLLWGYLTAFFKVAEKLLELFLDQNITNLKWKSL
jgi:hypothetical protein